MLFLIAIALIVAGVLCLAYVVGQMLRDRQARLSAAAPTEPLPATGSVRVPNTTPVPEPASQRPPETESLTRIDTDLLAETLKVAARTEGAELQPEEQLIVTGVLYQDHGRRIPHQVGRFGELPVRFFSEMRRVGSGTMILERSNFRIHCGNASYSYSAGDLDQIVFQESGVALVPVLPDRPVPVFITREARSVKSFIKKHARTRTA
ncbi:MAG: hypothetical protein H7A21_19085 [Spirochaetales bacterium]|nr:hypothetical protein [Leptospiraceae bacterium]MCP5483550.1 hypothetical protein [Spirochaetales bacterium]MCP5486879.1 hypothetical protein [Spirochaetales bacterium]